MIYLGSDHAGFEFKEKISEYLKEKGENIEDIGAYNDNPSDYTDFAKTVAQKVSSNKEDKGILFCQSGQGMAIAANRFKGIRATVAWNKDIARESRTDNDSNILSIPAGYISLEETKEIIDTWLTTSFSGDERHIRRLKDIDK